MSEPLPVTEVLEGDAPASIPEAKSREAKLGIGFKSYPSIDNPNGKTVKELMIAYGEEEWVATEKVHGANFSFCVDHAGNIACYKRSGAIEADEQFYNYKKVREKYEAHVRKAFAFVKNKYSDIDVDHVTLFGELYGGAYPHAEVKPVAGEKWVQKGPWYNATTDFYGFDVVINRTIYLDFEELTAVFEHAGFLYATPLAKGRISELLKFDVENFLTTIPKRLGLPELKANYAEGVVLRLLKPKCRGCLVKLKREEFGEGKKRAPREKSQKFQVPVEEVKIAEEAIELKDKALDYININRLRNLVSKEGVPKALKHAKWAGLLVKDALEDFRKEHATELDALNAQGKKYINLALMKEATSLLHEQEANLLAGEL